jgi:hypothetical protein
MDFFSEFKRRLSLNQLTGSRPSSAAEKACVRDALVRDHEGELQKLRSMDALPDMYYVSTTSNVTGVKPSHLRPPALQDCVPIAIADLQLGATHKGRVLYGRLIVEPIFLSSVASLIEDEAGHVVQVSCRPQCEPKASTSHS